MSEPAGDDTFKEIHEMAPINDTKVAPAHGIAALALNMALKYHDINTVQDGTLYQQYKLEGKNMHALHLDHVFETAVRMEAHIIGGSQRIAALLVAALEIVVEDDKKQESPPTAPGAEV